MVREVDVQPSHVDSNLHGYKFRWILGTPREAGAKLERKIIGVIPLNLPVSFYVFEHSLVENRPNVQGEFEF
jgi:hypothetical protein